MAPVDASQQTLVALLPSLRQLLVERQVKRERTQDALIDAILAGVLPVPIAVLRQRLAAMLEHDAEMRPVVLRRPPLEIKAA